MTFNILFCKYVVNEKMCVMAAKEKADDNTDDDDDNDKWKMGFLKMRRMILWEEEEEWT